MNSKYYQWSRPNLDVWHTNMSFLEPHIFFGVPHSNLAQSYLDVGIVNLADELLLSGISTGTGVEGDGSNSSVMIVVEKVIERLFHELIKY